jgi:hypothetical protein
MNRWFWLHIFLRFFVDFTHATGNAWNHSCLDDGRRDFAQRGTLDRGRVRMDARAMAFGGASAPTLHNNRMKECYDHEREHRRDVPTFD